MQFLLLFKADESLFDRDELERVFRSDPHFEGLRFDEHDENLLRCQYVESDDWALIKLSKDRQSISLNPAWGASLQAVLAIQKGLGVPLRVYNDDYTFDLTFSDIATVEELEAAMEKAKTS